MAKKAKSSQAKPTNGKSAAAKPAPAKSAAPAKVKAETAKGAKRAVKSGDPKVSPSKGPKIVAGAKTRAEVAVEAITSQDTAEETPSITLEQRYGSFAEAKSATLDALLASIEHAERTLDVARRASSFAELEQIVDGRQA